MNYRIKDGILHCDGIPKFAFGASYYPSFLTSKYPVPESGDRVGEMKKDLRNMKESGLNFFRTAALGEIRRDDNGEIKIKSDFIDQMLRYADEIGIAASVRLNGYSVNFSDNRDFEFVNNRGEALEKKWSAFMHGCMHHSGFLKDNTAATEALAKHFDKFPAVVSYQIYNEPHYPFNGVFDYNPEAIKAYKRFLCDSGIMTEEEAQRYSVPTERPKTAEELDAWVEWRMFSLGTMSRFLDSTAASALDNSENKDTYTCYTTAACSNLAGNLGVTYFDDSKNLKTTGITTYTPFDGADYYAAAYTVALAESSAAVMSKRAWTAELDKRTHMPTSKFCRETYEVIGAGHKGICYYQWRGDYPDEKSPLPDNCGFLHYDGTPTDTFEDNLRLINMLNSYSTEIVTAEKVRCHTAVLHSDRAYMYYDALSDPEIGGKNMWMFLTLMTFRDLKKYGFAPDFVRACDLAENKLDVKTLFIPSIVGLSDEELAQIEAFCRAGDDHRVFYGEQETTFDSITIGGWWDLMSRPGDRVTVEFRGGLETEDLVESINLKPLVETNHKNLFAHVLEGEERKIVVLVSNRPNERSIPKHRVSFNFPVSSVTFRTHKLDKEIELEVSDNSIMLPTIEDGGLLFVR